jgi:VIT1/CCC1 family predicted Fe2+/Mn2+ transporter
MSRSGILIVLGVLIILAPFSGLPVSIRSFLAVVLGAGVSVLGLMIRNSEARAKREPVVEAVVDEIPEAAPQEPTATGPRGVSPI